MTGISQTIPNYIAGMSDQPDDLKIPGQLSDALNVVPDITSGLMKRPGGRLINPLTTSADGKWFSYYRDANESYVGKINKNGTIQMWSTADGLPRIVLYSQTPYGYTGNELVTPTAPDSQNCTGSECCDLDTLNYRINMFRDAETQVSDKRAELEGYQGELAALQYTPSNIRTYDLNDSFVPGFFTTVSVNIGILVPAGTSNPTLTTTGVIPINPPQGVTYTIGTKRRSEEIVDGYGVVSYDIYAYSVESTQADKDRIAELEAIIEVTNTDLEDLKFLRDVASASMEAEMAKCGNYTTSNTVIEVPPTDPINPALPDPVYYASYLVHENSDDLQVLTVNDYTFITNRAVNVSMSNNASEIRPNEAYIKLETVAANRQYTVNLFSSPTANPSTSTRVTKLKVVDANWSDDRDETAGGFCEYTETEVFDYAQGQKTGLRFELATIGQSVVKNVDDPQEGYYCEYTTSVSLLQGGTGWQVGDTITVSMNSRQYTLVVDETSTITDMGDIPVTQYITASTGTIDASTILDGIKNALDDATYDPILGASWLNTEIIGNGIYCSTDPDNSPFKDFYLTTSEAQLLSIAQAEVNDVSRLPPQCKAGMVLKVVNTAEDEDDYWVKFSPTFEGNDGDGIWEECAEPGGYHYFNWSSLPHQIVRQSDGSFVVTPIDWEDRLVGDDTTNPQPSFVGNKINKILFHRNRLVLLSNENIILSQPGDFFNFWAKTALTVTASDAIDISCSSTYPAILYDGVETAAGLLLFSANEQFLFYTDNDTLSPETAKITTVANYQFNQKTRPISMGATVGFFSDGLKNSRFFEISQARPSSTDAIVIEQSRVIAESLPKGLDAVADSKENNMLLIGSIGTKDVWGYRWFQDGERRLQSAWFHWKLSGTLLYHCIMQDTYFAVLSDFSSSPGVGQVVSLQRFDLKDSIWTATADDATNEYQIHLDNYRIAYPDEYQWYPHKGRIGETYFRIPIVYKQDESLVAYALKNGKAEGVAAAVRVEVDNLGTWAVLDGNWSGTRLMLGYKYQMRVLFPQIYVQRQSASRDWRADTTSSLVLHRIKLLFGDTGVYETIIKRKGRPNYTELYESAIPDGYIADEVAFLPKKEQIVPIYDRNTNVQIELVSDHPSPATLLSMSWEGDLNNRYYKRV